jgi:DNA-directed RNA polymerase specialized sigma24 family protein
MRSFLFGICLGVSRNEQRRQRVRRVMCVTSEQVAERASPALSDDDAREALGRLCRVLASVAPEDRSLFVGRHVDQIELAELAAARGWSLPVTKRRVARMNRRLALAMLAEPALAGYAGEFLSRCGRQTRCGA